MAQNDHPHFMRISKVVATTGIPKSSIYAKLNDTNDDFPRPRRLGPRSVAWMSDEVYNWMRSSVAT